MIEERTYGWRRIPGEGVQASCRDVDCPQWRYGWQSVLDESTPHGRMLAARVRALPASWDRTETTDPTGLTIFVFGPGQTCPDAGSHRMDAPERYAIRIGCGRPTVVEPARWVDDLHTQTDRLSGE
jgi:hypothetical protein